MNQVNRSKLAKVLGVSLTTLDNWVRNGCPHTKQGKSVLFNPDDVQKWLSEQKSGSVREDILIQKLKYQTARARREELEVLELEKKLIPLDKLHNDLTFIFLRIKIALLQWEKRLPPLLEGKDRRSMLKIIHGETVDILNNFARGKNLLCKKK